MKRVHVSRRASLRINDALDRWLPPVLRDSRPVAALVRRMYGPLTEDISEFKERAFYLSRREYADFYQQLRSKVDQGITDLTPESLDAVVDAVRGERVLDVACGRGHLAERLAADRDVVGCDVAVTAGRRGSSSTVTYCEGNLEQLPFRDGAFDTVVSTHTLEHVQHLSEALAELRRIAARRLVIVVPRQRPYRVTFNPHIQFFPYRFSLLAWTGTDRRHTCELVGGDWLYVEDTDSAPDGPAHEGSSPSVR
ncbi:MAG: class I SAM-dependent methyltransferase [Acidimicrobiia bacterium]|nr:class I SAM-dependent methyltransferase [Acidimicrobiia bacterium]